MSLITDQHHYFPSEKRFHTIPSYPAKQLLNKTIDLELNVRFNHFNTAAEDITFELHALRFSQPLTQLLCMYTYYPHVSPSILFLKLDHLSILATYHHHISPSGHFQEMDYNIALCIHKSVFPE
jgi:hypothetical protein